MPKPLTGEPSASRSDTNRSSRDPLLREPTIASRPSGPATIRDAHVVRRPGREHDPTRRRRVAEGQIRRAVGVEAEDRDVEALARARHRRPCWPRSRSRWSGSTTMPVPMSLSVEGAIETISLPSSENPASSAPSAAAREDADVRAAGAALGAPDGVDAVAVDRHRGRDVGDRPGQEVAAGDARSAARTRDRALSVGGAKPWAWAVAGRERESRPARRAAGVSLDPLHGRDAAVAVAEHELHQPAPAGEVARARAAAEREARPA